MKTLNPGPIRHNHGHELNGIESWYRELNNSDEGELFLSLPSVFSFLFSRALRDDLSLVKGSV